MMARFPSSHRTKSLLGIALLLLAIASWGVCHYFNVAIWYSWPGYSVEAGVTDGVLHVAAMSQETGPAEQGLGSGWSRRQPFGRGPSPNAFFFGLQKLGFDGGFPLWVIPVLIALPTTYLFWIDRRRLPEHCCSNCGYNLTGNVSGVCPECGHKT